MKKTIVIVIMLVLTGMVPSIFSQTITELSIANEPCSYDPGTYLIHTEWGQHGYYKRLCPFTNNTNTSRCRLGCWSVAIGQIINYHSPYYDLQSRGEVAYDCSNHTIVPWEIKSDLDDTTYSWSNMSNKLDNTSPDPEIQNVSRLLYDTAIVIQKDFGTGSYLTIDNTTHIPNLINELVDHFPSINTFTDWDVDLTEAEIVDEIDHGRPIMFYTQGHNQTSGEVFAHAMIIDGYNYTGAGTPTFEVHINYGWDGPAGLELANTWYNYYGNFPTFDPDIIFDEPNYRKGLFIRMAPKFDYFVGPECAHLPDACMFTVRTDFDTDPPLEFHFEWGDGASSGWLGPYRLEEPCSVSHTWRDPGVYEVKVKVKNVMGGESEWSDPLTIHVTRFGFLVRIIQILIDLRDRFPGLEPLLTGIIGILCM